jgi:starvation-inducible DNA-binding protein
MLTMAAPTIENGLDQSERKGIVSCLAAVLDDIYSLMVRTQVYHWNVEGTLFEPVHNLTQAQYTTLFAAIDELAERIRALDGKPAVNINGFPTGVANIPEHQSAEDMIADLIRHHEAVVRRMRAAVAEAEKASDVVTADMLTGFMGRHEKDAWMLRAILKRR